MDDFAGSNGYRATKDGTVKDKGMELAVFPTGVDGGRKVTEKGCVEFAAREIGGQYLRIDARGDGTEVLGMEKLNEFARVALPDGKNGPHIEAREIFLPIGAQIFQEDVPECDLANALIVKEAQGVLHSRLVNGIYALLRDANFV